MCHIISTEVATFATWKFDIQFFLNLTGSTDLCQSATPEYIGTQWRSNNVHNVDFWLWGEKMHPKVGQRLDQIPTRIWDSILWGPFQGGVSRLCCACVIWTKISWICETAERVTAPTTKAVHKNLLSFGESLFLLFLPWWIKDPRHWTDLR